ncbi:MAG: dephospho-CoA kinase [Chloroflexi bacterium]|nr:dephospho-CoA kinase [Chloroflexota bacterium]
MTIGLTGGIGSGKSEVADILRELGAQVIDADLVGHETYRRGEPAWDQVVEAFGSGVVGQDGEIDRGRLGRIVFGDPGSLKRLTDIVWPRIREGLEKRITRERDNGDTTVLVVEAAVLFEAGWDRLFDEIWVVTAPEADVLERLERQRNQKPEQTRARLRAQMTNEEREKRADVTVRNDDDRAALAATVRQLWTDRVPNRTPNTSQGRHDG